MITWSISPLPDFLADHTLSGSNLEDRMQEVASRWIQMVYSLSTWSDRAVFCLRFRSNAGTTKLQFLADAFQSDENSQLAGDLAVLFRAHRFGACIQMAEMDPSNSEVPAAIVESVQFETRSLWQTSRTIRSNQSFKDEFQWLSQGDLERPPVIYPWWSPGGPFLLPMESLVSQSGPCSFSVYLQPTKLADHEFRWLNEMSKEAQTLSQQSYHALGTGAPQKQVDPMAELSGRLYSANLRRLSSQAFLVSVHCSGPSLTTARNVAGSFQSVLLESSFDNPHQDDARLPTGAKETVADRTANGDASRIYGQFTTLRFPWVKGETQSLARLPYLADARGAATAFRLPISVRSGVPGIRVAQLAPDFHPGPRIATAPLNHIELGRFQDGGVASIPVQDLVRHGLISGTTGSGKSNTAKHILRQLWEKARIPFLVLESAKQDYRTLMRDSETKDSVCIYTVGNESCFPIRLNPFELLPGIRVESHVGKLQACFEASMPSIGPSSSIIAEALHRSYEQTGWELTDHGEKGKLGNRRFPTLASFIEQLEEVVSSRGYEGEVRSNMRAAIGGRLRPLLFGSKGSILSSQRNYPSPHELFNRPTILELNDLNLDDKALISMFLLVLLREYREENASSKLQHVTLIEEAHNVLANNVSKGSIETGTADTRFKAVESFCQLIAEIRSYGEGILLVDQSPQKIARDAIRNTNLQIVHQLRDPDDRNAVAKTMLMDEEQESYLGKLSTGKGAVFFSGLEKATFIQVPSLTGEVDASSNKEPLGWISDDAVRSYMQRLMPDAVSKTKPEPPFAECVHCRSKCQFRKSISALTISTTSRSMFQAWQDRHSSRGSNRPADESSKPASDELLEMSISQLNVSSIPIGTDSVWCWLLHSWNRSSDSGMEKRCDQSFYERLARFLNSKTKASKVS